MNNKRVSRLIYAALCLALALVLPLLTGQNQKLGQMLCPMHIPALLCGFLCGWPWGLAVGLIAPPLRSLLFGMPPMFPTAISMAFELATYGAVSGLLYKLLPKKAGYLYAPLVVAMLCGRVVGTVANLIIAGIQSKQFIFGASLVNAFIATWPGILVQLLLVPLIVMALKKAKLTPDD